MDKNSFLIEAKADRDRFIKWYVDSTIAKEEKEGITDSNREEIQSYAEALVDEFINLKNRIKSPYNDFYYWIKNESAIDFDRYISNLRDDISKKQNIKQKEKEGAELIYSDDTWKVYHILNYEASAKYGKGTKWCITGTERWNDGNSGEETFKEYHEKNNVEFYFFIKNGTEKYAVALYPDGETTEIFNAEDVSIAYIPDAPHIEDFPDVSTKDDKKLLINALASGNIDEDIVFTAMEELVAESDDYSIFITSSPEVASSVLDEKIPDGYLEFEAVCDGRLSKEEYKEITGEELTDDEIANGSWYGDLPDIELSDKYKTKAEACNTDNFKEHKYWIFFTDYQSWNAGDLYYADDLVGLYNNVYQMLDFKSMYEFIDAIAEEILTDVRENRVSKDILINLGISDEYINSLTEKYHLTESLDSDFDFLVDMSLDNLNKFLDEFGFEVELVKDYDFDSDALGIFLNSIQDNASVFPIALNKEAILNNIEEQSDLGLAITTTIAHEVGHGIFNFLEDFYDLDRANEEDIVEEFARDYYDNMLADNTLYRLLLDYNLSEDINESLNVKESYDDIKITEKDLEDYLANDKYSKKLNRPTSTGPMVLLRSGNIYDISTYETHPAFAGAVGGYFGYEYNEDEFDDYDMEFLDYLEEELGLITLNPGDHAFEDRLKIVCESKPTSYQLEAIRDFIDEMQTRFPSNTTLYLWVMNHSQTYELGKYTSDELIKKIRMVFVRGRLEEKNYAQPNKLYNIDKETAYWPDDAEDYIYWHSEADKWAEEYAKSYKVKMSPKDFLDLTTTNGADSLKTGDSLGLGKLRDLDVDEFNKELYQNIFLQIAFRDEKQPNLAQVVGHEGRHRMFALMQAGVKSVDVELIADVYNTNYNKYKPFNLTYIVLIGQFNKSVRVRVDNPIAMSWKQHKSIRPSLTDENLNEYLDEIRDEGSGSVYSDYSVYVTDEVYKLKSILQRADKPYRIYNLDETYYFQDATGNLTHGDMLQFAKDNGYIVGDTRISSEDSDYVFPEDEDIGYIVFIPKNFSGHIKYHTRLGDDAYDTCKVYSFGNLYVRDSEEYDDGLFKALGEAERTLWYDELEGKVSITDKNNNTREFDILDDLEGNVDNADTVNLITKELVKEDFSKSARNCLDALDKMFGQEEVYMLSTYILPNGHFLNPDNARAYFDSIDEEPGYEHYDFEDWAYAQGFDLKDIYDNCVKMNVTYPYLSMPDKLRPTNGQLMSIKKIIDNKDSLTNEEPLAGWLDDFGDKIKGMSDERLAIFSPVGDEVFDLKVSDANDIVKAINTAYVRGSFNESLQLREDSGRDTFIFKGKKAWSGAVNTLDGTIEEVHSYKEAKNYGFHHSFYFSEVQLHKMEEGETCFFCVFNDHTIMVNAMSRFNPEDIGIKLDEKFLERRIKEQIKFIDDIDEELSRDEVEDRVANELGTSSKPVEGPSYILRDGTFLKIWNSNKDIKGMSGSQSVSGKTMHLDVDGFIDKEIDSDAYSYYYLNQDCIRVNTGFEEYIVLSKERPNNAQFDSLLKWLNYYFFDMKHDRLKVMDWYGSSLNSKEYYLDTTMPEEIIKKIKSYYTTGELRENKERFRVEWTTPEDSFEKSFSTYQKALDYYTNVRDGEIFWSTIEMYDTSKSPAELLAIDYKSNADIDRYINGESLKEYYDTVEVEKYNNYSADVFVTDELYTAKQRFERESFRGAYAINENIIGMCYLDSAIHDDIENAMMDNSYITKYPAETCRFLVLNKSEYKENMIDQEIDYYNTQLIQYEYDKYWIVWIQDGYYTLEDTKLYEVLGKPINKLEYVKEFLQEKIVKKGNKWQVQSKKGRNLGTYDTKKEAEKRLQQVHYFKHVNEELSGQVYYHGSSQKIDKLNSSINWITDDKEYAKYYALALSDTAYVYTCEADLDNIFDAGRTGDNVFALMPITKPYKLSIEMKRLADRLNLSEEDTYKLVQDAISEYPQNNEYRTKISTIVRSNAFKKILQEKGYTSIHTIEYNVPEARYCDCYGILNNDDVKILSSEEVTRDAKLNDK